ncbi:ABC-2 type transporter [Phyllosticta capitalensis]|uniref:ABC-2 type transporter n=2 Tax=Phyllosticta capitalensis TaxID=121624 RepID=A0ABR1YLP7_9PEZI
MADSYDEKEISAPRPEGQDDDRLFMPIRSTGRTNDNETCNSETDVEKSEKSDDDRNHGFTAEDEAELMRLATTMSRQGTRPGVSRRGTTMSVRSARSGGAPPPVERTVSAADTLAGLAEDDPIFDPTSDKFDLYKWLRKFIRAMDEEQVKIKRAGISFKNLNVHGTGSSLSLQATAGSLLMAPFRLGETFGKKSEKRILKDFNGVVKSGELLIVLGRPGSGCSTLLKSLTGELEGLQLGEEAEIHYNGIPLKKMMKEFKGEMVYNQEVDKHFPHLTVGQTLEYATSYRTPSNRIYDASRDHWAKYVTQVVMTVFGLSHTYNTKVGNDFVRGVSGGERKRVSIAEMMVAGAPIGAWDNSTRGLDAATALEFVKALRLAADLGGSTHAVAIYQASQAIYDVFDKAIVLYEGRQIYYGPTSKAKQYFEDMGWYCPPRQTTGDFLTSVTNPVERQPREGYEDRVPRTPDDFERYWRSSEAFAALQAEIAENDREYPIGGNVSDFQEAKRAEQAKHTNPKSPYLISVPMQIKLNTSRAYQRIWNDKTSTLSMVGSEIFMALIISSIFFGTKDATQGFFAKNASLFFAVLLNALMAISEINSLYAQRPIVEKHNSYAFYHPFTEAVAGVVSDIPVKFVIAVAFNVIYYFISELRKEADAFFLYFLIVFISMFVMSAVFRTMAAITKTVSQAMALAGVLVLVIVVYTGFVIPGPKMHDWFKWLKWLNPVYYAFEILIANEYHGKDFTCSEFVPTYSPQVGESFVCSARGAIAGRQTVNGDDYIQAAFDYTYSNVWRNFGILCMFLVVFMGIYFAGTEINSSTTSTAEVLVFRRGHVPSYMENNKGDEEGAASDVVTKEGADADAEQALAPQKDVFTWRNVVYDIEIKGEPRRLLDNVSGWVKPGTLTALMGVSGAGKTTLLDALAQRTSMGVITGDMFVNGKPLSDSFQRSIGYVQQQDLHLETATVRESLQFSAKLRQPKHVPEAEKLAYVEDVIKMLNMEDFAEAVVGVPGEGLNVEQRKLLTIGVELAAKPKLLLFLDEPTSGLDSQSSWAICAFMRKLANNGHSVISTIHQPSAILFQQFDRLLFLAKGGKTVYFGDIGENSRTMLDYFESNGGRKCSDDENPAEYMLECVGAGASGKSVQDWHEVWKNSKEAREVQTELDRIHRDMINEPVAGEDEEDNQGEFALSFMSQLYHVSYRIFQQYWRMPGYVWAKIALGVSSGLFIGFSFWKGDKSLQGMQNILFSVFMVSTIFSTLVQQVMPLFVTQRSLYEVRERPSKAYSWQAFLIANIIVEIPYQIFVGILVFACYYYPVMGVQSSERQVLVLLYCIQFFVYASSFAHMCIAGLPNTETAGAISTTLFALMLTFNGVMQTPDALPGFWIWMYRVSPFTYWVSGIVSSQLHARPVECASNEISLFNPPANQTCGQYMAPYLQTAPGLLQNPDALSDCRYCSLRNADQFLASSKIYWADRWRNFGIGWAFVLFNIAAATLLYYLARVRTGSKGLSAQAQQKKQRKQQGGK